MRDTGGAGDGRAVTRTAIAADGARLRVLAAINGIVAVALFAALTIVVLLQVFTRFVLHIPFLWSEEAARFLFFWVVLLGAAMSVRNRRHFAIDFTMGRTMPWGRARRFLFDIVPDLCVLGYSLFLLVQGIAYARVGVFRTATNSHVNMGLVYAAIPVFAGLSLLYTAANLIEDVAAFLRGQTSGPRAPTGGE
jgi:TRAP-type C4-dicarboxylate transport system permease small subunit